MTRDARNEPETTTADPDARPAPFEIHEQLVREVVTRAAADGVTLRHDVAARAIAVAADLATEPTPGGLGILFGLAPVVSGSPYVKRLARVVWLERASILRADTEPRGDAFAEGLRLAGAMLATTEAARQADPS